MTDAETTEILRQIAAGNAFPAEVENDLGERGLIVQTDQPYASLTAAGRSLLAGYLYDADPENGPNEGDASRGLRGLCGRRARYRTGGTSMNEQIGTRVVYVAGGGQAFHANVLGENLALPEQRRSVDDAQEDGDSLSYGNQDVRVLYGNAEGLTCIVYADDAEDALRRLHATFPGSYVDDLQSAVTYIDSNDLADASNALALFAGIDEGENTDYDRLMVLSRRLEAVAGTAKGLGILA